MQGTDYLRGWQADKAKRQQLNGVIVKILIQGPDRVVVAKDGRCETSDIAVSKHGPGVRPRVVYIRADGMSFGGSAMFAPTALKLWQDDYVCALVVKRSEQQVMAPMFFGEIMDTWEDREGEMDA